MIFDDPMVFRLGCALLHFVWQGALIAGILAIVLAVLRRKSPNVKYAVCWVAFSGMALCVPLTAWLIDEASVIQTVSDRVSKVDENLATAEVPATQGASSDSPVPVAEAALSGVPVPADAVPALPAEPLDSALETSRDQRHWRASVFPWVVAAWLVGTIGLALWRLGGWLRLRRYCRLGVHPVSEKVLRSIDSLLERFPVGRSVALLESTLVRVPMVVGWLRPVILFPVAVIAELPPQQLEMILAHELAHIRRRDYLWNLIQTVIETLLFYHPAVWWVSRRIRVERECCCDELAAGETGDRLVYARTLARLEELRQRLGACPDPSLQVAASDGSLLSRIRRVLGRPHEDRQPCYGWSGAWVVISVLLALMVTYVSTERIAAEGASVQTVQGNAEQEIVETPEEALPQSIQSNGLELVLAIEDQAASPQRSEQDHNNASSGDSGRLVRIAFRNVGDWPLLLNTWLLATHLTFEISDPRGENVTESWRPVTGWSDVKGEHFPRTLAPGQIWETTCPLHSVFRYESTTLFTSGPFRLRAVYRGEQYPFIAPERAESDSIDQYVRQLFQSVPVRLPDALQHKVDIPESDETRWLRYMIEHSDIPPEIRRILLKPETDKPQHTLGFPSTPVPVPRGQQGCWEGTIRSNPVRFSLTEDELTILKAPIAGALQAVMLPPDNSAAVNTERHAQIADAQKFAGIVTDEEGSPLEGVRVKMCGVERFRDGRWHRNRSPDCVVPRPTISDKNGRFAVEFTEAWLTLPFDETKMRVNLWFSKDGYAPTYVPGVVPKREDSKIILPRGIRVSGTVKRRANGQLVPVQDAVVYLQCSSGDLAHQRRVHEDPYFFLLQMRDAKEGCDLPFRQRVVTDAEGRYTVAISSPPGDKKWYLFCSGQAVELVVKEGQPPQVPDFVIGDQPREVVGRWSALTGDDVAAETRVEGGNITFEFLTPVFLNIKALQKQGPDTPIKTVLDQWTDKPSPKYDLCLKTWKANQPSGGFVYGDNRVYRKVAINYLRYDRETTIESGVKSTTIHDTGAGCRMNAWIPSETGDHTENIAARATPRMRLEVGREATLYELCDPQSPNDVFFRLTICLAPSRPPAARTGVEAADTGKPLEDAGDSGVQRAARAATIAKGDEKDAPSPTTAHLQLTVAEGSSKSVTVTLGQTAREIVDLCKPTKVYADDDPWLAYAAVGGGSYLLLFAAEGTAEEIRGTLDPRQDTLYAVVHYPNESRSDGEFLLPKSMRERTCGDFVTLKVPVTPDKVRVATVVLGMNATDVMGVFHPALDRAEEDDLVVFDSIEAGARYRLIFSSKDEGGTLLKVETHRRESSRPSDQRRDRASGSLQLHPDRQENSAKEPAAAPGSAIVRVVADSDPPLDEFDIALIKTDAKVDPRPFMNKHAHFQLPHADVVMGRTRVRQDADKVRLVGLSPGNYIVNVWADDYVQVGPRCPVTLSKADFQRLQPGVAPPEHAWFVIPAEQFQIQSDREIEIGVRMERLWAIRGRVESAATETTGQNQTTAPLRHVRCRYVGPKGNGPFYPDETGRYHVTGLGAGEVTLFFERDGGKKNEWSRKIVLQVKPGDTYRPAAVEVPLESEPVPERPPAI